MRHRARCTGAWTLRGIAELEPRLDTLPWPREGELIIDASSVSALDTAGAWLLQRTSAVLRERGCAVRVADLRP